MTAGVWSAFVAGLEDGCGTQQIAEPSIFVLVAAFHEKLTR